MSIDITITTESLRPPLTGIGYYTARLIEELLAHPEIGNLRGLGYSGYIEKDALFERIRNIDSDRTGTGQAGLKASAFNSIKRRCDSVPGLSEFLRKRYLTLAGRRLSRGLVHAPNYIAPDYAGPSVITVHDLSHIRHPETHPKERVKWLNEQLPRSISQASRIICVSEFTKQELIDLKLAPSHKISVCYNGIDPDFYPRPASQTQPILDQWNITAGSYLLSVATFEPRKNLESLLEAYGGVPPIIAQNCPLVLTGASGWMQSTLQDKVKNMPGSHRVVTTGYVTRQNLKALIAGAGVFAYPSLYEGFGLPVVEAMASGVPVVTSNCGALAEVVGDSGYTVPPKDTDALGGALLSLLTDDVLTERYRNMGIARAKQFSWRQCAKDTVLAYRHALGA